MRMTAGLSTVQSVSSRMVAPMMELPEAVETEKCR